MASTLQPLAGLRVLVPRSPAQAPTLSARVRELGGQPVEAPTILIEPGDDEALRAALRDLAAGEFGALCLTSPNGVEAVADALERMGLDLRALAGTKVACIGPGTAAALQVRLGVHADLVPARSTTSALADAFPHAPAPARVLLARADIATNRLADGLRAKGWVPEDVVAYRTVAPPALPGAVLDQLAAGDIDLLPFASSSTARNFAALVDGRPWRGAVVSIGPVTTATCREIGLQVAVEAELHDLDGLVAALVVAAGHSR